MTPKTYPVAAPVFKGNEKKYVMDCIDSTWISSKGKYIPAFEEKFADFCGVKHAIAAMNGTAALHLALLALGIGPEDEVIVPALLPMWLRPIASLTWAPNQFSSTVKR